jgi:hypothetical protein
VKKILLKLSLYLLPIIVLAALIIQLHPLVMQESHLKAKNAKMANEKAKVIWRQFSSTQTYIEIELNADDINAIAEVASHTFDNTEVVIRFNRFMVIMASTTELKPFYINFNCTLKQGVSAYQIDGCYFGNLYVPGFMINSAIRFGAWFIFDNDVSETVAQLLTNIKVSDEKIILATTKTSDFKERINSSLKGIADIAKTVSQNTNVASVKIEQYLSKLDQVSSESNSLSNFVNAVMQQAMLNSIDGNPVEENTAALWALAIKFGSLKFARLAGIDGDVHQQSMTLSGRPDLSLHFLYSAMLQQIGRENIGLKIGEFKEILDSAKGGSGFSFADLAANKAGLAFAEYLTRNNKTALKSQDILVNRIDESIFFPFIHDLPEGIREDNFTRVFGRMYSKSYNELEANIDQRIAGLKLYGEADNEATNAFDKNNSIGAVSAFGKWLKIDTHIHTRYSDGNKTVSEVAQSAHKFGCDVIAITDHGDKELIKVLSDEYFSEINNVSRLYPKMNIIPGFEWNIPPFGGREHATVLFADTPAMKRQLRSFRDQFDHYKEYKTQFLSSKPAFQWLNTLAEKDAVKPVVIYNHPSRKNFQTAENQYDMQLWVQETDVVIGLSGAPGHQRKRGINNGSYQSVLRTIHGWDPSIAIIGGEWDKLLQKGYRVTAARAASDFHNVGMDYWPCQFSSTHLFSESNAQNDVLMAMRQGQMWAQHGKFVESLKFSVNNEKGRVHNIGSVAYVGQMGENIEISLEVNLAPEDWQGFATSLDELELIIITEDSITTTPISVYANMTGKRLSFEKSQIINSKHTVVRIRGRSIQPETHHYMFYTNPIYIRVKNAN